MTYAVRNDGQGWRAVTGPDDVGKDEWYCLDSPPDPVPLPPTPEETLLAAIAELDRLLSLAAIRIAPLQDAVDIDDATSADIASLKKWKQYRVALNRIDQQEGFPEAIEWPTEPV